MSSANLSRAETADRSRDFAVRSVRVELDLTGAEDAATLTFPTSTTFELDARADATWLDFLGASVESVAVDGRDVPVRYDGARILLDGLIGGERETSRIVTVTATALYSRSGEGLHRFVDPVDGETYLYTHDEPADARRVFACFEQPDLKAPYSFVVHAPAGWTVLSNAEPESSDEHDGCQTVTFSPTLPLPSYITAVIAGPYHGVRGEWSRGEQAVPLGVYCRASLAQHLDAGEIIDVTRRGLDFFTDAFEYPYPWGGYDQVFVPEYNIGAMENPGCVTFTERYIFRGASTDAEHEGRANTILHEMAHMWFGDLVTMKWWDDLWLKESFADYMGALATTEATGWSDAWVTFANRRKAWAYLQDQLPTTHPIAADIVDLEAAKLAFDGITYAKGAAVLKQLVAYVGRDAFFEGARRYFREHAFGNTTLDDLLAALEDASGRDLHAWSRAWLQTTGVTTLTLEPVAGAAGELAIVPSDDRPHRLAVGWYDEDATGRLTLTRRQEFDIAGSPVPIGRLDAAFVLLNDGDLTYAKVRLDETSLKAVEAGLSRVIDPLARGQLWSALWNAVRDGELPASRFVDVVCSHAPAEKNTGLLASVLGNAQTTVEHYAPVDARPGERRRWLDTTWSTMLAAPADGGVALAWARAVASAAEYDDGRANELRALLAGSAEPPAGLALDPDLRWRLLTALSATGHAAADELTGELERDDTASGRTALIEALAARPDPEVKATAWHSALTDLTLTNDHLDATIAGFTAGARRDLTAPFDGDYFGALREVWQSRSIEIAERIVIGLFPLADSTDAVDDWLRENADAPGALLRLMLERRDQLARDLRVRAANEQGSAAR
ncbi:aminopeptidase N [Humibacter ginsenosidimutans]|uniref:Aminopeptidase N n=1 Tax=Humibacter ginsenosidimutans TaxID=2599293 RepID=A0A5B8M7G6_9MICO|nr:aminopeptidase N [Humibacter ginsenosidimutans]QDZ16487.1 aminopeptidase N [Humibacter ginsenosidimutans]